MKDKFAINKTGFLFGILLFLAILLIPSNNQFNPEIKRMAACTVLMAVWWLSEAIPLPATALLPLLLFPVFGLLPMKTVAIPYADPNVFLFMGGFMIAMAMQKHDLHRRIALNIINIIGSSPKRIILGFMIATAFLSMWISNTATAMMMLPIGIAIADHMHAQFSTLNEKTSTTKNNFGVALMLSIAYAASIGGVGTLIGTPPNIVFAGISQKLFPQMPSVSFVDWLMIGLPVVIVFLPIAWLYLVYLAAPVPKKVDEGNREIIKKEIRALGRMSRGEILTLIIFCTTAMGWIFRKDLVIGNFFIPGWSNLMGIETLVHDGTVAMIGALLLFIIPTSFRKYEFVLNWEWAKKIPWGILLLFGGGFALATGFQESGLDIWIGNRFSNIHYRSLLILIISVCLLLTFLTEITSNTATITMMLPVLAALSIALEINPFYIMIPATISTSFAFMMPVATPPNAIVFGSKYLKISDMARAGFFLNLIGVVLITCTMYLIVIPLLSRMLI